MVYLAMVENMQDKTESYDTWFRREVEDGIREADSGELIPLEEAARKRRVAPAVRTGHRAFAREELEDAHRNRAVQRASRRR